MCTQNSLGDSHLKKILVGNLVEYRTKVPDWRTGKVGELIGMQQRYYCEFCGKSWKEIKIDCKSITS